MRRFRLTAAVGSILAFSMLLGIGAVNSQPAPITGKEVGKRVLFPEISLFGINLELIVGHAFVRNPLGYRSILARFGAPNDVYAGDGGQTGGFGVGGHGGDIIGIAAGTSAGAAASGGGGSMGSQSNPSAPSTSQSVGITEHQQPEANVSSGDAGFITWLYTDAGGYAHDTLAVTFDEQADGAVAVIRYYGTNFTSPVATTHGKIRLGSSFFDVLQRYGYPDLTISQTFGNTAAYFFAENVIFGFQGSGNDMRVNSITINSGLQPLLLPPGQQGTTASDALTAH